MSPSQSGASRTTSSVLAHVQAERAMQVERWGWHADALLRDDEWDALVVEYLSKPGASRYVRLVQVAALAVAAAERLGIAVSADHEPSAAQGPIVCSCGHVPSGESFYAHIPPLVDQPKANPDILSYCEGRS